MKKILISACLAGDRVRYDGKQVPLTHPLLNKWHQKGMLVTICPEVSGGLSIPRPPAQIVNGNGLDVLEGRSRVLDIAGRDVTGPFIRGAEYAFTIARKNKINIAILKEKSPSCGVRQIYDGRFAARLIPGFGVTAALLKQNGIQVFSENELDRVKAFWEDDYLSLRC
ncbi:DUF523 domain-containing protein [Desulfobacula sp.]|uniref:DUF523 domain-containing protein n=1 Tax=Desulfobacula sp. TaxID=2593537 RepID=UPI00261128FA|nr:DUF523 domain-containing protein [Desulfobacula sp.]